MIRNPRGSGVLVTLQWFSVIPERCESIEPELDLLMPLRCAVCLTHHPEMTNLNFGRIRTPRSCRTRRSDRLIACFSRIVATGASITGPVMDLLRVDRLCTALRFDGLAEIIPPPSA